MTMKTTQYRKTLYLANKLANVSIYCQISRIDGESKTQSRNMTDMISKSTSEKYRPQMRCW